MNYAYAALAQSARQRLDYSNISLNIQNTVSIYPEGALDKEAIIDSLSKASVPFLHVRVRHAHCQSHEVDLLIFQDLSIFDPQKERSIHCDDFWSIPIELSPFNGKFPEFSKSMPKEISVELVQDFSNSMEAEPKAHAWTPKKAEFIDHLLSYIEDYDEIIRPSQLADVKEWSKKDEEEVSQVIKEVVSSLLAGSGIDFSVSFFSSSEDEGASIEIDEYQNLDFSISEEIEHFIESSIEHFLDIQINDFFGYEFEYNDGPEMTMDGYLMTRSLVCNVSSTDLNSHERLLLSKMLKDRANRLPEAVRTKFFDALDYLRKKILNLPSSSR